MGEVQRRNIPSKVQEPIPAAQAHETLDEMQRRNIPSKVQEPVPAAQAHENLDEMQRKNLTPFGVIKI